MFYGGSGGRSPPEEKIFYVEKKYQGRSPQNLVFEGGGYSKTIFQNSDFEGGGYP